MRLLDETINNDQANCADGSVLFASLLRKIGIEAYLVMVPRHCYLAFALDEKGEKIVALETTLIGSPRKQIPQNQRPRRPARRGVAQGRFLRRLLRRHRDGH